MGDGRSLQWLARDFVRHSTGMLLRAHNVTDDPLSSRRQLNSYGACSLDPWSLISDPWFYNPRELP